MINRYQLRNSRISPRDSSNACSTTHTWRACATLVYLIRTYIVPYVYIYIYIFFLMLYFSYVSMYVYVCMCTCMYYGSAEVFARDFRTIKTQTYAGKRDVHIGLAWKRFNSLLFHIVSIFVNLPGDYFSIGSITRRAQVNKDNTSRYVRCCWFCYCGIYSAIKWYYLAISLIPWRYKWIFYTNRGES